MTSPRSWERCRTLRPFKSSTHTRVLLFLFLAGIIYH